MDIDALPTEYAGCIFRSRTEARWAIFWDLVGVRWEFEPEGYRLASGAWYLPDFWLRDLGCYAEVKPGRDLTDQESDKVAGLAEGTGRKVLVLAGAPWPTTYRAYDPEFRDWMEFCWHDKYLGPDHHDATPRVYWGPADYEAGDQATVSEMMERARHTRLDEPTARLPLGWDGVEVVV